jgi:hypothetical protein
MVLVAFARSGAGDLGTGLLFLFGYFVVCGVVAGRAVAALLRALPHLVTVFAAIAVGLFTAAGAFESWGTGTSDTPLLPALFPWAAVPALLWAGASPRRQRRAAIFAAAASAALWLLGAGLDT